MDLGLLGLVVLFVFLGGFVKGIAGFGFGILGTTFLAIFIPVQDAVTVMIFPLIAVNLPLIMQAEISKLNECIRNYTFFLATGILGALIGVLAIKSFPVGIVSNLIGVSAILYVYSQQDLLPKPRESISRSFTEKWYSQSLLGSISGVSFGGTNIGLPFVVYLDRIKVDRKTFVGLLSLLLLGATAIRATSSYILGLYSFQLINVSLIASLFGLVASTAGSKINHKIPEQIFRNIVLVLILVAGLEIITT